MNYIIEGNPIPLARPRFYNGHVFDSQKKEKLCVGLMIKNQHGDLPLLDGPLHLAIDFFMRKPKSMHDNTWVWHIQRPDLDNMVKFYLDVVTNILFHDDKQIAKITATKIYDSEPRTEFTLTPL